MTPMEAWQHARTTCLVFAVLFGAGATFFIGLYFWCVTWKP